MVIYEKCKLRSDDLIERTRSQSFELRHFVFFFALSLLFLNGRDKASGKSCVNLDKAESFLATIFNVEEKRLEHRVKRHSSGKENVMSEHRKLSHRFNLFGKLYPNRINTGFWRKLRHIRIGRHFGVGTDKKNTTTIPN